MSREVEIEEIITWPELTEVRDELTDPRFLNYTHGGRSTYSKTGCRGPLCKRAQAVSIKKYTAERRERESGRKYKPYNRDETPMAELLDAIILWHREKRALFRAINKVTTQEVRKAG